MVTEKRKKAWKPSVRVLHSVSRSWTFCDGKFETIEEFKQNYMNRVELQNK